MLVARVMDDQGDWSVTETTTFFKYSSRAIEPSKVIVGGEYFFNADPGPGQGFAFDFPDSDSVEDFLLTIPLSEPNSEIDFEGLPNGINTVAVRVVDNEDNWSRTETTVFFKYEPRPIEPAGELDYITYQFYLEGAPASPEYRVDFAPPMTEVAGLEELASLAGLDQLVTYQLVVTAFDTDGDQSVSESIDVLIQTADSNFDGIVDEWALRFGYDINADIALLDDDGDGLTTLEEFQEMTNPLDGDSDDDNLNDAAEAGLRAFGFDPNVTQTSLVNDFFAASSSSGLFSIDQVSTVALGRPLIQRASSSDPFLVTFGLLESTDLLGTFNDIFLIDSDIAVNGSGDMEFEFDSQVEDLFLIIEADYETPAGP